MPVSSGAGPRSGRFTAGFAMAGSEGLGIALSAGAAGSGIAGFDMAGMDGLDCSGTEGVAPATAGAAGTPVLPALGPAELGGSE